MSNCWLRYLISHRLSFASPVADHSDTEQSDCRRFRDIVADNLTSVCYHHIAKAKDDATGRRRNSNGRVGAGSIDKAPE
jgi:hypothetical protein